MEGIPYRSLTHLHSKCETISDAMSERLPNDKEAWLDDLAWGIRREEASDTVIQKWLKRLGNIWRISIRPQPTPDYKRRRDAAYRVELNYYCLHPTNPCAFLGYLAPVKADAVPVVIPIERLEGEVDWDENALTWHDVRYVDVRVVPPSEIPYLEHFQTEDGQLSAHHSKATETDSKPATVNMLPQDALGTPKPKDVRETAAVQAAQRLKAEGAISAGTLQKEVVDKIIKEVAEREPDLAKDLKKVSVRTVYGYVRSTLRN